MDGEGEKSAARNGEKIDPEREPSTAFVGYNNGNEAIQPAEDSKSKKIIIGCVIIVLLAVSWVGTQQFAQSAVQLASFDAPYFATWLGTCWVLLCFPVYGIIIAVRYRDKQKIEDTLTEALKICGTTRLTVKLMFLRILPMNILWLVTNYLYVYGLKYIAATDASAIFASNVAFVYMLSLCMLHERLYFIRISACLLCITGVVLFAYAEGFAGGIDPLAGILMAVASAFGAALYKVVFKIMVGTATFGQVCYFLTMLGACNCMFMWVVFVILYTTGTEYFAAEDIPWTALVASNFLGLVFNLMVNFGVAYTFPLFISIAMMLGVPLNAAVDALIRHVTFSAVRLVAAFLVILGFVVMLFPDRWNEPIHTAIKCQVHAIPDDSEKNGSDERSEKLSQKGSIEEHQRNHRVSTSSEGQRL